MLCFTATCCDSEEDSKSNMYYICGASQSDVKAYLAITQTQLAHMCFCCLVMYHFGLFLERCGATQDGRKARLSSTLRRTSVMLPGTARQEFRVGSAEGSADLPGAAAREELLGGELVVRVEDATVCLQPSALDVRL